MERTAPLNCAFFYFTFGRKEMSATVCQSSSLRSRCYNIGKDSGPSWRYATHLSLGGLPGSRILRSKTVY